MPSLPLFLFLLAATTHAQDDEPDCKDLQSECESWALAGDCIRDRDYMDAFCQRSCNPECLAKRHLLSSVPVEEQLRSLSPPTRSLPSTFTADTLPATPTLPPATNTRPRLKAALQRSALPDPSSTTQVLSNPLSLFGRAVAQVEEWAGGRTGRGECANNHEACIRWAEAGECLRDEEFMLQVCALSCDAACGGGGKGAKSRSALIPADVSHESYVQRANARSPLLGSLSQSRGQQPSEFSFASIPDVPSASKPAYCTNRHSVCGTWAEKGECELYPELMRQVCPASCLPECKDPAPLPFIQPPPPRQPQNFAYPQQQEYPQYQQPQQYQPQQYQPQQYQYNQQQYFPYPAPAAQPYQAAYQQRQQYYPQQQPYYPQGPPRSQAYQPYSQQVRQPYTFGNAAPPSILPPNAGQSQYGGPQGYPDGGAGQFGGVPPPQVYAGQQGSSYYPPPPQGQYPPQGPDFGAPPPYYPPIRASQLRASQLRERSPVFDEGPRRRSSRFEDDDSFYIPPLNTGEDAFSGPDDFTKPFSTIPLRKSRGPNSEEPFFTPPQATQFSNPISRRASAETALDSRSSSGSSGFGQRQLPRVAGSMGSEHFATNLGSRGPTSAFNNYPRPQNSDWSSEGGFQGGSSRHSGFSGGERLPRDDLFGGDGRVGLKASDITRTR